MKELKRYEYKLMNLMPEVPQGHTFYSYIPNLHNHPELWQSESPYFIDNIQNVYVEFIGDIKA